MKLKLVLLIFFISSYNVFATTYTVCSSGCDQTTIQAVFDGVDLAPNDIVEVRADAPGAAKSYSETVTPGTNDVGTAGNPVILRARAGDTITIDGGDVRDSGFIFTNVSYFTLDGFTFSNHTGQAIYGRPTSAKTGWTIQNCTINISLSNGVTATANQGIALSGVDNTFYLSNVVIDNVHISTGAGSLFEQTDGITLYYVDTATVKNSNINIQNYDDNATYQHIDGIQTGNIKNLTVFNNTIYLDRNHANGMQGIYIEGISSAGSGIDLGTWLIYNNLIYGPDWGSNALGIFKKNDTATASVYNNTIVETYASTRSAPFRTDITDILFKNNIVQTGRTNIAVNFESATQTAANIDYNLLYNPSGSIAAIGGSFKTWAQWQAAGYDASGANSDPLLDSSYKPTVSSPTVAKTGGVDLSGTFTTDLNGTTRTFWGAGAYFADTVSPVVTAFTIPATASSLTISISSFTATDAVGVTGYCIQPTNSSTGCTWTASAPTTYPFGTQGAKTLYAFAKDAAGNISTNTETHEVDTDSTTITLVNATGTAVRASGTNAVYGSGSNAVRQ
jgi:hypothetical protein